VNLAAIRRKVEKMRGNSVIVSAVVALALIGTVGFVAFRSDRCGYTSEAPVWSPDGKWVVSSTTRACPAGPLSVTNYDVFVTLNSRTAAVWPGTGAVQIVFESQAAEPPSISWTSTNEVSLNVMEEGTVTTSKHEAANIRFKYVVPKWIWDSLRAIETDRLQRDRDDEELFKAGKCSGDDLRISLETNEAVAEDRTKFRQWVLDNATVEGDAGANPRLPR
jgi:hypothetical protein